MCQIPGNQETGPAFFSAPGAIIALTELVLFSPVLIFALRWRRARRTRVALFSAAWLACVWLIVSSDPIRDAAVGFVLRDTTAFAGGFSEGAFRRVTPGTPAEDVRRLLGAPLEETWMYLPPGDPSHSAMATAASSPHQCVAIEFRAGVVVTTLEPAVCRELGIDVGASAANVKTRLGSPSESCWRYSESPQNRRYRLRMICFAGAKVSTVVRRWE